MSFAGWILKIDNILWATPLIALTFGSAILFCIFIKFGNMTKTKLQWKLLTSGEGSQEGISPFETFCSVAAYRVAVGNIGGAFSYGVKRAVNSSGSGFGETPPSAAAAETPHPTTQGMVNAFSVYIDVAVCFCSGIMALGETNQINIEDGKTHAVKYLGLGDHNEDGTRSVLFELNGMRREISAGVAGRKASMGRSGSRMHNCFFTHSSIFSDHSMVWLRIICTSRGSCSVSGGSIIRLCINRRWFSMRSRQSSPVSMIPSVSRADSSPSTASTAVKYFMAITPFSLHPVLWADGFFVSGRPFMELRSCKGREMANRAGSCLTSPCGRFPSRFPASA